MAELLHTFFPDHVFAFSNNWGVLFGCFLVTLVIMGSVLTIASGIGGCISLAHINFEKQNKYFNISAVMIFLASAIVVFSRITVSFYYIQYGIVLCSIYFDNNRRRLKAYIFVPLIIAVLVFITLSVYYIKINPVLGPYVVPDTTAA